MKKIFLTRILSFALIGCETTSDQVDSDLPSVVDAAPFIEIYSALNEAMNNKDIESATALFNENAVWSFPNEVEVEGVEAIGEMLTTTTSIWDNISNFNEDDVLALEGTEDGETWNALMAWGEQSYSNDDITITVPYHLFMAVYEGKIQWLGGLYDRTKFVEYYDQDPIK